jgi:hypothetical protein
MPFLSVFCHLLTTAASGAVHALFATYATSWHQHLRQWCCCDGVRDAVSGGVPAAAQPVHFGSKVWHHNV